MTPPERDLAYALEFVEGVIGVSALSPEASARPDEQFAFVVELWPYSPRIFAAAHYAILGAVGRELAGRVTFVDADQPRSPLMSRARPLRLSPTEREAAAESARLRELVPKAEEEPPTPPPSGSMSILVIDDNPATAAAIVAAVGISEDVTAVKHGFEMVRSVIDGAFDAIFCDISAPEGERFYTMVSAHDSNVLERFVFVTGPRHMIPESVRRTGRRTIFPPLDGTSICDFIEEMRAKRDERVNRIFGLARGIPSRE